MTIATLKEDIASWLDREDLTEYIPRFIAFGANRIYRTARTVANERVVSGTATNGVFEIPADLVQVRYVAVDGRALEATNAVNALSSLTGLPESFTRIGDKIYLFPAQTTEIIMDYYFSESVANDSDNPALYQVAPDLFLYASLIEASSFLENDNRLSVWERKYAQAFSDLKTLSDDADLFNVGSIKS